LLEGLERARADRCWQPDAASETRRRQLLPAQPAPDWDALQRSPAYRRALALIG